MRDDLLSAVRIVTTDVPASSNAAAILPEERTGPMRPTDADRTPMPPSSKESSDVDSWW